MTRTQHWFNPPGDDRFQQATVHAAQLPPDDLPSMSFGQCRAAFAEMSEEMLASVEAFFRDPNRLVDAITADEITFAFGSQAGGEMNPDYFMRGKPNVIMTAMKAERIEREEQFERMVRRFITEPWAAAAACDDEGLMRFAFSFGSARRNFDATPEPFTWPQVDSAAAACLDEVNRRDLRDRYAERLAMMEQEDV